MKKTICYIYRNSIMVSIEVGFHLIEDELKDKQINESFVVPLRGLTPVSFIRNIIAVSKIKADIIHVTGEIHYVMLGLIGKKTVLTIHDLGGMHTLKGLKRLFYKYFFVILPCRIASSITVISEFTKEEVLRYSPKSAGKITIIPPAIDKSIMRYCKPTYINDGYEKGCPKVLLIGSTPNKNHVRVIDALSSIKCSITIIGMVSNEILRLLNEQDNEFRVLCGLATEELYAEYSSCDLVIFASTYEGFGMIIPEAQLFRKPVITSDLEPMKSVAGKGACLVDPYSIDNIKAAVIKCVNDSQYRESIVKYGYENAKRFRSDVVALAHLSNYALLLYDNSEVGKNKT